MTRAAIALGSNLGNRREHVLYAVEALSRLGEVCAVSKLYETAPVGGPEQDAYLNAVAVLETTLPAEQLLAALHVIESERGRARTVQWGPRTLDLDLLLYGMETLDSELCTVPHPRLAERRFVLEPLLDAWPEARLPDGTAISSFLPAVGKQELKDLGVFWAAAGPQTGFGNRGGWWVVAQFVLIGLVVGALGLGGPSIPGGSLMRVVGTVLAVAGGVQGVLGLLQLGDRLTPFPEPLEGDGMIHGGVYSMVRHPIYGGIVLGLIGISLFQASVYGMLLAIVAGVFFWMKAGREEDRLTRRFPHYAEYRSNTRARLIPWVV